MPLWLFFPVYPGWVREIEVANVIVAKMAIWLAVGMFLYSGKSGYACEWSSAMAGNRSWQTLQSPRAFWCRWCGKWISLILPPLIKMISAPLFSAVTLAPIITRLIKIPPITDRAKTFLFNEDLHLGWIISESFDEEFSKPLIFWRKSAISSRSCFFVWNFEFVTLGFVWDLVIGVWNLSEL